nr:retrovirus-related Pol polyprotein from transposon TNT 1-94 [Tanacetum cinerariifolium]
MTATLKYKDVPNDAIKLMFFPYSLEDRARIWYEKEPPNSILTWDDLVNKFVNQFFPPSKATQLKNEISRFTQRFEETFSEAWDRFKALLRACPHHEFSELTQIDTFYNGLTDEPYSYFQASKDPRWQEAMNKEIKALEHNKTWEFTTRPPGKKTTGSKWVFRIKLNANGSIKRFKARLVAQGCTQKEGIDYKDTLTLVSKIVTMRCLLSIAIKNNWFLEQFNNAFVHGDLNEEVYIHWFEKPITFLIQLGFKQSYVDTSLFTITYNGTITSLLVYVDDILLISKDSNFIKEIKTKDIKPIATPMDTTIKLNDSDSYLLPDPSTYKTLVGKLLYLTIIRPDLSFAALALSQYSHSPRSSHYEALLRVLRYIKLCPGQG